MWRGRQQPLAHEPTAVRWVTFGQQVWYKVWDIGIWQQSYLEIKGNERSKQHGQTIQTADNDVLLRQRAENVSAGFKLLQFECM